MSTATITDELSDDDIARRLAELADGPKDAPDAPVVSEAVQAALEAAQAAVQGYHGADYRYYTPLEEAADDYVHWAQRPNERIYIGVDEFDRAMRGTAPGELTLIVGYAHSGKTLLITELLLHNRDRRVALFTPDETRTLVLIKLVSVLHGIPAEELELQIAADNAEAIELVRSTARDQFPNLAVFDESLSLSDMDRALTEVEHYWGDRAEAVIIDYASLVTGVGDDDVSKINASKTWGKKRRVPLFLLHQSSRTAGANGAKVRIDSGGFGGEQQATFVIGVRRKKSELLARIEELREKLATQVNPSDMLRDRLLEAEHDLRLHEHTITFNLVKCKRPPSRLVDDLDFTLDADTGRIKPFYVADAAKQAAKAKATSSGSALDAVRARFKGGIDTQYGDQQEAF